MGKTVMITGGTGMLGQHLIEQLMLNYSDYTIYVLFRNEKTLSPLLKYKSDNNESNQNNNRVEFVRGDILDYEAMSNTIPDNLDAVFHMAAATSQWSGDNDMLVKVNVDGTNNIIKFCLEKRVKKLVYTSSIAAYAPPHGSIITEASPKLGAHHISYYNKTKLWSEENVLKAVRDRGLNACILNPCQVLGKYDSSSWAQFFDAVINNKIKVMGKGGGCFANAAEVAKAHIEAIEKGKIGENYILGGPARSFMQLAGEICKLQGVTCSLKEVPDYILRGAGTVFDYYSYYWSKTKPIITPEAVERLTRSYVVLSDKAKADLKYNDEVPFEQSVQEEYKWIVFKI